MEEGDVEPGLPVVDHGAGEAFVEGRCACQWFSLVKDKRGLPRTLAWGSALKCGIVGSFVLVVDCCMRTPRI